MAELLRLNPHFTGIEEMLRVKCRFECLMNGNSFCPHRLFEPRGFCQAYTVLSRNAAAVSHDPIEKTVHQSICGGAYVFTLAVFQDHDVGVYIAVSGMPEACHGDAGFLLHGGAELNQRNQSGARNDDILIELGETGGFQAV